MVIKEIDSMSEDYFSPSLFKATYMYAPGQLVKLRIYGNDAKNLKLPHAERNYVESMVYVKSIEFDEPTGSAAPIAHVEFHNCWRGGEMGGSTDLQVVLHRYDYQDEITEDDLKPWRNHRCKDRMFYVTGADGKFCKFWPFKEEKTVKEKVD